VLSTKLGEEEVEVVEVLKHINVWITYVAVEIDIFVDPFANFNVSAVPVTVVLEYTALK